MIQTIKFRLHPTTSQEKQLHEIFTIYNRVKRVGYKLRFQLKDTDYSEEEKRKIIQPQLMQNCHNNPYVNTILIDNEMKLAQQHSWLKKRKRFMRQKVNTISNRIEQIKQKSTYDRRLKGLYSRLSSVQNRLMSLELKPVVFGTKTLFRKRILKKISEQQYKIRRDASFSCVGKVQGVNLNIKILEDRTIRIHTFRKERNKIWLIIPFSVNQKQEYWYQEILKVKKYTATIKRKLIKGEIRYFAHISHDIPEPETIYRFENGAIGLDLNYNFVSLSNVDKEGNFKSHHQISFRNLHTFRKERRMDYINYKMDKIVNYCLNKKKGLVIENLNFDQKFTYNKKLNRKLSNFKTSALEMLERKCVRKGVGIRKVHPAYTSLIGKYKYSRSYNLSNHILASYVIARRGLGFKEAIPAIYEWLLSQVGDIMEPRLKKGSPYRKWSQVHDFFKYSGITSFKTSEVMKKALQMKYVLNSATRAQPDNLRAGLSPKGEIDDYHKFWNSIDITYFYK